MIFINDKDVAGISCVRKRTAFTSVGLLLGGYETGFDLVAGSDDDALERFVVLSMKGSPRLLLPVESPAMDTAVSSFLGRRTFSSLVPPLVRVASWAGTRFLSAGLDVSLISRHSKSSPLRALFSRVLARQDFQIAMRLSFDRPNAKTVAMAISDNGEVLCFAKFGSESMTNGLVSHESAILEQFENTDTPMIMPRRLYSGPWAGGHHVLITAPLALAPLDTDATIAHKAIADFSAQNSASSTILRDSVYWQQIAERIQAFADRQELAGTVQGYVDRIDQAWGSRRFDFGASHGDWSRANVGLVEGKIAALDWERSSRHAPQGIDIAHFAICESSFSSFRKTIDVVQVSARLSRYLQAAGLPLANSEPLVLFALLEMVLRFRSAQLAGLNAADRKFEPALEVGLRHWAT